MTRVQQVVVFCGQLRVVRLRKEMVEVEFAADSAPAFADEAIDAPKRKVVSQPWAKRCVVRVASWSVTSYQR